MDWKLFYSFEGRINRAGYWLLTALALIAVLPAAYFYFSPPATELHTAVAVASLVAALYLQLVSAVKRLHDRNRSGFLVLVFGLGATMLERIGDRMPHDVAAIIFYLASLAVSVWFIVEVGFRRGTSGPNAYGPDPLERSA